MPWRAIDAFGSDDCTEGLELPILCGGFRTTDVTVRDAFVARSCRPSRFLS